LRNLLDISEPTAIVTKHIRQASVSSKACSILADFFLTNEISNFILTMRIYPPSDQPKGLWRGFVFYDICDCGEISCLKNL
jgi:hypothetical protein